ncbi:MAG: hypothetical protein EON96_10705 [Caulobacteraceae bacterium]|nr:MAG: hypothetical protein EON96_10705 [Caulobacteraceae bacterium]
MSLNLTLILLAASLGLAVFTGWRGSRPPDLTKGPRMAPWRFLMLLSGALATLLLIHLGTLMGMVRPQ